MPGIELAHSGATDAMSVLTVAEALPVLAGEGVAFTAPVSQSLSEGANRAAARREAAERSPPRLAGSSWALLRAPHPTGTWGQAWLWARSRMNKTVQSRSFQGAVAGLWL